MQRTLNALRVRWRRARARPRLPMFRQESREILQQHSKAKEVLIFPPGLGWRTHLFQRPQQLALALARQGALVFYLEPELSPEPEGFQHLAESLYLGRVPVETFRTDPRLLVYTLTWNRVYLKKLAHARVLYDFVDDLAAFDGPAGRLEADHRWLLDTAELVLVTAERLRAQVQAARPDALLCPNGVDYRHFAPSRQDPRPGLPADLAPVAVQGAPIIGYYGALARWFDYNLLGEVAHLRPEYVFILIGPDLDGSFSHSHLRQLPNVHRLGRKDYAQLPVYLAHFSVATIPFRITALSHATSPLKLFEYMAGGKPVVTTPMEESMRYPGVLAAAEPVEFAAKLDEALALGRAPAYLAQIDQVARENSWSSRAETILAALQARAV